MRLAPSSTALSLPLALRAADRTPVRALVTGFLPTAIALLPDLDTLEHESGNSVSPAMKRLEEDRV